MVSLRLFIFIERDIRSGRRQLKSRQGHRKEEVKKIISTRNQESQVEPESKPTKVYIDRACSAKCLSTRIVKPKAKNTVEASVNTTETMSFKKYSPSRGSEQSSLNTPSNNLSEVSQKSSLFRKYNSNKFNTINASGGIAGKSYNPAHSQSNTINTRKHTTRHSIDLEKQFLLQQKYHDSLNNYP